MILRAVMWHLFQSTLPLRGATEVLAALRSQHVISIHAPLTGSDSKAGRNSRSYINFNPRSPYGERRARLVIEVDSPSISIHAPLTGSDRSQSAETGTRKFQSTLPLRGATTGKEARDYISRISIHAPLTGSDAFQESAGFGLCISIHAPLTGSDRQILSDILRAWNFNPRSPYGERRY